MATKLENLALEIAHFAHFKSKIPNFDTVCDVTIDAVAQLGGLQVSTLFEQALAAVGGHTVVSLDKGDLYRSGAYSDVKLSTVRTSGYGKQYSAPVTSLYQNPQNLQHRNPV